MWEEGVPNADEISHGNTEQTASAFAHQAELSVHFYTSQMGVGDGEIASFLKIDLLIYL